MSSLKGGIFKFATTLSLIAAPLLAAAQAFPTKPVRLIIPFPPGGITDGLARAIAQDASKVWGQQVIVENRPGASQIIGAEALARSAPDGYTMLMVDRGAIVLNPLLYSKLPYDPAKDFAPVINLANMANVLAANRELPVKSLQELVVLAKGKPGEINYGSLGLGSVPHLHVEALSSQAGMKLTHVPYKGLTEVIPAMMSGQIHLTLAGMPFTLPLIQQGKIKALAVGSPRRSAKLPDLPTFAESGFPEFESQTWFGLMVPASTPQIVIEKIAADVGGVISQKVFVEKYLVPLDFELLNQGPEQFAAVINSERVIYARYVKAVNIKLD